MSDFYCARGHAVAIPNNLGFGRSWCGRCEDYVVPLTETELKVLREASGVRKPTWRVYENVGSMKGTWAFSCSGCGECGGNYRDKKQAEDFAERHTNLPHERKWLTLNERI